MVFNNLVFLMQTEFKDDPDLHVYPNLKYVGIELWQVIMLTFFFFWALLFFHAS